MKDTGISHSSVSLCWIFSSTPLKQSLQLHNLLGTKSQCLDLFIKCDQNQRVVFPLFSYSCQFQLCFCSFRSCWGIGQESSFLLQLESMSNFSFLQDCYSCFPSGFYHLSGLGFHLPLDFCKSPSCFCFVCGVMIRFRKQLLRFRAVWAQMPTTRAGCQITKIVGSAISRGNYGQTWHWNIYDTLLFSKTLGCTLMIKLNHDVRARN